MCDHNPYDLRVQASYTCFCILVIGWANAGKMTLLQRVCNTTKDPCIYDENNKNLLSVHSPEDGFCFVIFYSTYYCYLIMFLTLPIARDTWYRLAIRIQEQPRIHLPWFETGNEKQLQEVLSFMEKKAKSLHAQAIWSVSLSQRAYCPLMISFAVKGFVLFWTVLGLYCHWKQCSLRWQGQEKLTFYSTCHCDLYQIRWSDDDVDRQNAEEEVEKEFWKPLYGYAFPPRVDVCFEGKCWLILCRLDGSTFNLMQVCILLK